MVALEGGLFLMSEVPLLSMFWAVEVVTGESISQKVFIKLLCKSQFPHKSGNLSFITTTIQSELADLCGN